MKIANLCSVAQQPNVSKHTIGQTLLLKTQVAQLVEHLPGRVVTAPASQCQDPWLQCGDVDSVMKRLNTVLKF